MNWQELSLSAANRALGVIFHGFLLYPFCDTLTTESCLTFLALNRLQYYFQAYLADKERPEVVLRVVDNGLSWAQIHLIIFIIHI